MASSSPTAAYDLDRAEAELGRPSLATGAPKPPEPTHA